jgi:gamma-glutamyltranspeptidase/glutathione hydrolase
MKTTRCTGRMRCAIFTILLCLSHPGAAQPLTAGKEAVSPTAMAATANPFATEAAISILRKGGNAVDGAVAAAFAIGVVEPDGSGLGGGGGMVIALPGEQKSFYVNYYHQTSEDVGNLAYRAGKDNRTARAILVPGTVEGLLTALERFGTLPRATVIAPAIRLAEEGFPIDETLAGIMLDNFALLQQYPGTASVFLRDGFPLAEGDTLRQPALAQTLRAIAAYGRDGFYGGEVAQKLVDSVTAYGGVLTPNDLHTFHAQVSAPVEGTYRGYRILSAAIPQSGASIVQALNMLEQADLCRLGNYADSVETFQVIAEVMRRVYADRSAYVDDPRFARVPVQGLTSKEYAQARFLDIDLTGTSPVEYRKTEPGDPTPFDPLMKEEVPAMQHEHEGESPEGGHTTHLTVVDREGNAVSLTQTLGTFFGSGLTVAGVVLNSGMANFSSVSQVNAVRPVKQPRSSIAPTIILKNDSLVATIGSPGATRIIATVIELIVNVVDYGMNAAEANAAPRFLCQKFDDYLSLESRISPSVREGLEARGHRLKVFGDLDLFFGGAQIITVDPQTRMYHGSADPRRGGYVIGY